MKKKLIYLFVLVLTVSLFAFSPTKALASINNPVLTPDLGGTQESSETATDGSIFVGYMVSLWETAINIGGLLVLFYFIWGSIEWITAGGDSGKLEKARLRMMHAVVGLLILVSSFVILGYISTALFGESFSILNLSFPTPNSTGAPDGGWPGAGH
ncbi:MAG: hypothetical protein GW762_04685 [Candidatus Pacebacteria bacterium]|nr:hypothetical protein [Candidatus Paceibacterota bacterium]PIR64183.1 MAG: hypothetical protein COU64_00505 [Candidatus Pacebacteria bacterium CG10_big_fil_rev_8_21_14_0_10_40_26]PIZ79293.1 MAG: hypothetical protein COY01_02615 [Candidatus Pacebacteria bacterium CG_4_10_14_0_2_um_filter_40_20]PJA68949.1 MAG: hypothetical protein CO156_03225 [Candidatus Pacebacteria bacterium CG_4_9_14_3_um_filter_40_12]PJC42260.1 MAG: hypothetical protein CO041_01325 [Candidatus Pacebacteria bacterium CG_4_9_